MRAAIDLLTLPVRNQLRRWVVQAFPRNPASGIDYDAPLGDEGLFGPDSVTWRVHAEFCGMLSGGLSALMLQTLHPLALAGVWDHSNFRTDLVGRLRRTTAFIGATTYAPRAHALAMIERVHRIHAHVHGTAPDGRSYSARSPELLTWVHVTEVHGFLAGFRRFSGVALPPGVADRYLDEMRRIAEALGARDVPGSERELAAYFDAIQPELAYTERSREVLAILSDIRLPVPVAGLSREVFLGAGATLLPDWARSLLGHDRRQRRRSAVATATLRGLAPMFRAALREGIASRSCRRVGIAPERLRHFPVSDH